MAIHRNCLARTLNRGGSDISKLLADKVLRKIDKFGIGGESSSWCGGIRDGEAVI